jgi:hypothetical protein
MVKKYGFPDFCPDQRHATPPSPNKKTILGFLGKTALPKDRY